MLDSKLRPFCDRALNKAAKFLATRKIAANHITYTGFAAACLCFIALWTTNYLAALILILINRLCDGLDGAVATQPVTAEDGSITDGRSDLGGFLDIVSDFIFYSGFVFFFAAGQPQHFGAAAFVLFSYFGSATTFLSFAIMSAKAGEIHERQGKKSFYYLEGLAEGTETLIYMALCCLIPAGFGWLSILFGLMCWLTTIGRTAHAVRAFK